MNALSAGPSGMGDDLGKYRTRYEESMNPFEVFKGRVSVAMPYSLLPPSHLTLSGSTKSCASIEPH